MSHRSDRWMTGLVIVCSLALGPRSGAADRPDASPAEPYPLSPEMSLLEQDVASPAYRALLHRMSRNINDLNAEWQRIDVDDDAARFAAAHGGVARVQADAVLRRAYERRQTIERKFLALVRAEYAQHKEAAPFDRGVPPDRRVAAARVSGPGRELRPVAYAPGGEGFWPGWRGPAGQGVSSETGLPTAWGPTENIAWKSPVPGRGNSSPVVWAERIFLTTALDGGRRRSLLCYSRRDGKLLWRQDAPASPPEPGVAAKNGFASSTPVADGERVIAFLGNSGLVCWDLEGHQLWHRDLGPFQTTHGTGSSPILYGESVILSQDQNINPSVFIALDKRTGMTLWRTERPRAMGWSTPVVVHVGDHDELITSGNRLVTAYDPRTGRELWHSDGPTPEVIPTVVVGPDLVYAASGRNGPTLALRPGGTGDVTATALVWRSTRHAPHVPSPVLWDGRLYMVNDRGIFRCLDARTGTTLYIRRLKGDFSASLVAADGIIYATSETGDTYLIKAGPRFRQLRVNHLGEPVLASLAIVGGQIIIRAESHLYGIGKPADSGSQARR